jgi:hypothetical protein
VTAALALVGASASAGARGVHCYGFSLRLPQGWGGQVLPGEIDAIAAQGAFVQLDEALVSPQRYVPLPRHVRAGTTRLFVEAGGRKFFLSVHTTAARLAETNQVLASVRAKPWSAPFAAPRFTSSPGWQVGRSGPQPSRPRGYVSAWASTVAYQNSPIDLPPEATLARAGARGVVVWVGLSRPRRTNPPPVRRDPLDLTHPFCTFAWEGGIPGVMQCTLWSQLPGRYDIDVYVYLRERSRLVAAQRELRRLVLPTWPRTAPVKRRPSVAAADASRTPEPSSRLIRVVIPGRAIAARYPAGPSVSFRYPSNWYLTRRRIDNVIDPTTLFAVSTYPLPNAIDDCDGTHARGRPADGAFLLVKEVLDGASLKRSLPRLPARPRVFRLPTSGAAGCLAPPSVAYQFRVGGRAFYVWISVGRKASAPTRAALASLLDGMRIASYTRAPSVGRANCNPPSPLGVFGSPLPGAQGTATRGSVWALFFPSLGMHWQPGRAVFTGAVGKDFKIVFRVTGSGPIRLSARGANGTTLTPDWGPQAHGGSTWNRPGGEWGVGFTFPTPGCYRLHAARSGTVGDVWVLIR